MIQSLCVHPTAEAREALGVHVLKEVARVGREEPKTDFDRKRVPVRAGLGFKGET